MTKKKKNSESSSKDLTEFVCTSCKHEFKREATWSKWWRCPKCQGQAASTEAGKKFSFIDMTINEDYFKKKRFMLRDKTWEKDIKARRTLSDGTVGRFTPDGKRLG